MLFLFTFQLLVVILFTTMFIGVFIEKQAFTNFCLDWMEFMIRLLSLHQVSLLYSCFLRWLNVLPEAVYFCFARTTLFTTMLTGVFIEKYVYTKDWLLAIVMYGLRLFIVVNPRRACAARVTVVVVCVILSVMRELTSAVIDRVKNKLTYPAADGGQKMWDFL